MILGIGTFGTFFLGMWYVKWRARRDPGSGPARKSIVDEISLGVNIMP
jgi:hypothetical protein